ncbi:MAG: serine/threonine protein kinase [Acidobacteria bacterium]|nr:serine/threonine protein kinase [Acidobacteriota bacterium]
MPPLPDSVLRHLQSVTAAPDLAGTPYELRAPLGRGAMGAVYAVFDTRLGREVAMKVLHTGGRIEQEARIVASLEHPGIVPVHETGELADGQPYYTMRLVRGRSLDAYLTPETPLSERLRVFQKVCETVAFAHSHGVLHRDLKPPNIMAGECGGVVILDWGIARHTHTEEPPGVVAGTPRFMAPRSQPASHARRTSVPISTRWACCSRTVCRPPTLQRRSARLPRGPAKTCPRNAMPMPPR